MSGTLEDFNPQEFWSRGNTRTQPPLGWVVPDEVIDRRQNEERINRERYARLEQSLSGNFNSLFQQASQYDPRNVQPGAPNNAPEMDHDRAFQNFRTQMLFNHPEISPDELPASFRQNFIQRRRDVINAANLQRAIIAERDPGMGEAFQQEGERFLGRTMPFVGQVPALTDTLVSARRIQSGNPQPDDYQRVARFMVGNEEQRNMPTVQRALNELADMIPFATEMLLTGGLFTAGRQAGQAAVTRAIGQRAANSVIGQTASEVARSSVPRMLATAAAEAPGFALGTALQTAANPRIAVESTLRRTIPGLEPTDQGLRVQDRGTFMQNLPAGALDALIEVGTERAGAALPFIGELAQRIPGVGALMARWAGSGVGRTVAALDRGTNRLLSTIGREAGYHGVSGEIFEELLGDTLRGMTGLSRDRNGAPDYGTVGDIVAGRWGEAGNDLTRMAITFGLASAVMRGGSLVGDRRQATQQTEQRSPEAQSGVEFASEMRRRGVGLQATQERMLEIQRPLAEALSQNPQLTRAEAQEIVRKVMKDKPNDPIASFANAMANIFPETARKPATAPSISTPLPEIGNAQEARTATPTPQGESVVAQTPPIATTPEPAAPLPQPTAEQRTEPPESEAVKELRRVYDAAKIRPVAQRILYLIAQEGASLEDIAKDEQVRKKNGKPYTAGGVWEIARKAFEDLGLDPTPYEALAKATAKESRRQEGPRVNLSPKQADAKSHQDHHDELVDKWTKAKTPEERAKIQEQIAANEKIAKARDLLMGMGPSALPSQQAQNKPATVGPFEISATIDDQLGMKSYVDTVPGMTNGDIAYMERQRAAVIGKERAGDAQWKMHEAGHHLALEHKLETNPALLPPAVRDGLEEFDYIPDRPMGRVAMLEGMAEWLRKRQTGQLGAMSQNQQAANDYLEAWVKEKKLDGKLEKIRSMFTDYLGQTAGQKAAGNISATGERVEPKRTGAETVASLYQRSKEWIQDNIDTNLGSLVRIEKEMKAKGLDSKPAKMAYILYGNLMFQSKAWAGEFEKEGMKTLIDGKWTKIGLSLDEILAPLEKEDLAAYHGDLTKFEAFAIARHVADEASKGRDVVPKDMQEMFAAAMEEFKADQAFIERATKAADNLTAGFNSTLDALASPEVHYMSPEKAEGLKEDKPTYLPLERIINDSWKESTYKFEKGRTGSGEQIVSPLISYKKRLRVVSHLMSKQISDNAIAKMLLQDGMGKWGVAYDTEPVTSTGSFTKKFSAQMMSSLGMADAEVAAIIEQMGPEAAETLQVTPWPADGTKPTWRWRGPDGKITNFRIGERSLYDLITGQQGDANPVVMALRWLSQIGFDTKWGRVDILPAMADIVRKGATAFNMGFQARNITRDAYEFAKNTTDQKTVAQIPEFLKRAYAYELAQARGQVSKDAIFNEFHKMHGDELRKFSFDESRPASIYDELKKSEEHKAIKTIKGAVDFIKQTLKLTGAGEFAPRALEFKTFLEKVGYPESRLNAMQESGEQVPFFVLQEAMNYAAEVTTPFGRQGVLTRELNKIHPFFGPSIAGFSKAIRNIKENPKGAAIAMGGMLGLRLAYWLMFHDEDWYKELSANDRYDNFVVPVGGTLYRLPGARELDVPVGGTLTFMLDTAAANNPDFAGLVAQSFEAIRPPMPITPPGSVAVGLMRNQNWMGTPIVPRRDQNMPAMHNAINYQIPYAAQQLLGGRAEPSLRGAGLVPFSEVRNARRSVDEYYDRLHSLETDRLAARREMRAFPQEREYATLHAIEHQMQVLSQQLRGVATVGGRQVKTTEPTDEEKTRIRASQLRLSQDALRRLREIGR